jgi:hypothetical protein
MAIRWQGCLVGRTWVSAQKGHNFWSDGWIAHKFLQGFQRLFNDEDVWSATLSITQKGHNFWSDRLISLKVLQGFWEAVFIGEAMEWLLVDEDVWSANLSIRLKGP